MDIWGYIGCDGFSKRFKERNSSLNVHTHLQILSWNQEFWVFSSHHRTGWLLQHVFPSVSQPISCMSHLIILMSHPKVHAIQLQIKIKFNDWFIQPTASSCWMFLDDFYSVSILLCFSQPNVFLLRFPMFSCYVSQEVACQSSAPSATASSSFTWPCAVGSAPRWHCQALGSSTRGAVSKFWEANEDPEITWKVHEKYMKSPENYTNYGFDMFWWWSDHWNMVDDWWWLIWTLNISEHLWTELQRHCLNMFGQVKIESFEDSRLSSGVWWSCGGWVPILWPWTICEKHGKHGTWEGDDKPW